MPTTHPRVARVATAVRPADPSGPGEDRVFVAPNAVIVLDGASHPGTQERDGGWIAEKLGTELRDRIIWRPGVDLRELLAAAIKSVTRTHDLDAGDAPSTTVAIARWTGEHVDALVLGDSPVVALTNSGQAIVVRDDRLALVATDERRALWQADEVNREKCWRRLVDAERTWRNRPGGFWVAQVDADAALHAITWQGRRDEVRALLAVTDGVAAGVDRYGVAGNWSAAVALALRDPALLIDAVHAAEASDPDRGRWPRSKRHDDKALTVVQLS